MEITKAVAAMVRSNIVRLGIQNLSGAWATTPIMVTQKPAGKDVPADIMVSSAGPRPGWWFRRSSSSAIAPMLITIVRCPATARASDRSEHRQQPPRCAQ
jgi:hypothetical protein